MCRRPRSDPRTENRTHHPTGTNSSRSKPDIEIHLLIATSSDSHKSTGMRPAGVDEELEQARRRCIRHVAIGLALIAAGLTVAVVLPLVTPWDKWVIAGVVVTGATLSLLGTRIAAGRDVGGEIVAWGGLLIAVAAIAVAIAISSH